MEKSNLLKLTASLILTFTFLTSALLSVQAQSGRLPTALNVDGNEVVETLDPLSYGMVRQFEVYFSASDKVSWWKGIKIFDKNGKEYLMTTQDNDRGPKKMTFNVDDFGHEIKIEFWKAKVFGAHTLVRTYYVTRLPAYRYTYKWMNE